MVLRLDCSKRGEIHHTKSGESLTKHEGKRLFLWLEHGTPTRQRTSFLLHIPPISQREGRILSVLVFSVYCEGLEQYSTISNHLNYPHSGTSTISSSTRHRKLLKTKLHVSIMSNIWNKVLKSIDDGSIARNIIHSKCSHCKIRV